MDCFLLSLGTHGDVELFRWLGVALARRGHRVTLGASPFYGERIAASGLEFLPIGNGTRDDLEILFRSLAPVRDRRARVQAYAERWARPQLQYSMADVRAKLARTDYFINNLRTVFRGGSRIVPGAAITYDPVGNVSNLRKYAAQLAGFEDAILELVAMPKALVDPGNDWAPRFQFRGFWANPDPLEERLPSELEAFLSSGPPPVAITMGSMVSFEPARFLTTIISALKSARKRGVLIGGWSQGDFAAAEELFVIEHAPYERLFPKCDLVLHHGGAGTVAATLRAGKPSILLPQIPSQAYFAEILAREGALVAEFEVQDWTATALAEAFERCEASPIYRQGAERWAQSPHMENGLSRAVNLIEAHAASV